MKKVGYGAIAGIQMRVQVRSALGKYNPEIFSSIRYLMAKFLFPSGWNLFETLKPKPRLLKGLSGLAMAIWEILDRWERESGNLGLTLVRATASILDK